VLERKKSGKRESHTAIKKRSSSGEGVCGPGGKTRVEKKPSKKKRRLWARRGSSKFRVPVQEKGDLGKGSWGVFLGEKKGPSGKK